MKKNICAVFLDYQGLLKTLYHLGYLDQVTNKKLSSLRAEYDAFFRKHVITSQDIIHAETLLLRLRRIYIDAKSSAEKLQAPPQNAQTVPDYSGLLARSDD
jgi:hypothetical protein